jgi:hypothetical protein
MGLVKAKPIFFRRAAHSRAGAILRFKALKQILKVESCFIALKR